MKITFGMIIFNSDFVLKQNLETVYPYAHNILVAEGPVTYWQGKGYTTSTDKTNQILKDFPDPENKIKVVHGQFAEKHEQANAYMVNFDHNCTEPHYVWNLDADEIFKPQDIETVISLIKAEQYTSVGFKSISFYGGFERYLTGFEEGAEFIRIQKAYPGCKWESHRPPRIKQQGSEKHLDFNALARMGIRMYHYSYVFPRQVKEKVQYYKSAVSQDNCIDNYFEKIYLPWTKNAYMRDEIENEYKGVHEFKPSYRGECRTKWFEGNHPKVILRDMEELRAEFERQLNEY
jgi:hypothetical protein